MKLIVRVVAPLLLSTAAANAFTQEQLNVMNHIAEVTTAAQLCPRVEVNETMLGMVLVVYDLSLSDSKTRSHVTNLTLEKIKKSSASGNGEDAYCFAALFLYGPNGQNVPDLVSEK